MPKPTHVFLHYDEHTREATAIHFYSEAEARQWLASKNTSLRQDETVA
jgi:hypothetical protein